MGKKLSALGEYFGKDGFVSFVELGSLGHWGGNDAIRITIDAPRENNRTVLFAKSTSNQP